MNSTRKVQPLDISILKQLKKTLRHIWAEQKVHLIEDDEWIVAGRLRNLGKLYLLELVEQVRVRINKLEKPSSAPIFRVSMIHAGLSMDLDGNWRISQLRSEI